MPKILLSNSTSRAMAARLDDIPADIFPFYDAIADRLLWTLAPGDIAVVPGPVKESFLSYLCYTVELDRDSISVLSLADFGPPSWYPRHSPRLAKYLRSRINSSGPGVDWNVSCYIRDRDIVQWERILGPPDATSDLFAQNMAELVNTKSLFRVLARSAGLPIADGRVVNRGDELYDAVAELLPVTGTVIVKQDQNSGGDGNVVVTLDPGLRFAGARSSVPVASLQTAVIRSALETVQVGDQPTTPAGCAPAKYVVEVFHPNALSFYAELDIPPDSPPRLCNFGDMVNTSEWLSYEIPPPQLSSEQRKELGTQAQLVAALAQAIGYVGRLDCDAILTEKGEIIFNEFNGRSGAATHIDIIARRLLGPDYLDKHVILARYAVRSPQFGEVISFLGAESLRFSRERSAGIIVTQDNTLKTGTIEYLAIGRTRDEAAAYDQRMADYLRSPV
jgi:Pre ATP-grasp domain/PGM1 C-terminal domain